jgi:sarcosine oxidase
VSPSKSTRKLVDVVVIGLGAIGAAAAWRLAQAGLTVTGIDVATPNRLGSSFGDTRMRRVTNLAAPEQAEWVAQSICLTAELESLHGRRLFVPATDLIIGNRNHDVVKLALDGVTLTGAMARTLTSDSGDPLLDGHRMASDEIALVTHAASGFINASIQIEACIRAAGDLGAEVIIGDRIVSLREGDDRIELAAESGEIHRARAVVLATGAWETESLIGADAAPMAPRRTLSAWFRADQGGSPLIQANSIFMHARRVDEVDSIVYGAPSRDGRTIKIGRWGGADESRRMEDNNTEIDADWLDGFLTDVHATLGGLASEPEKLETGVIDYSADRGCSVQWVPNRDRVMRACMSGRGFKMALGVGDFIARSVAIRCGITEGHEK